MAGCLQLEYLPEKSNTRRLPVIFLGEVNVYLKKMCTFAL